jgi:hypothetical protein
MKNVKNDIRKITINARGMSALPRRLSQIAVFHELSRRTPSSALSSEPAAKGYHCCIKDQEVGAT